MHTCGYHPPASAKALRRAQLEHGTPELREARMKPCGKRATFVQATERGEALYLCGLHAKHNAQRGFRSRRIEATR
jgi:hypothetical protein